MNNRALHKLIYSKTFPVFLFIIFLSLSSCHYYRATTLSKSNAFPQADIERLMTDTSSYIIVHFENQRWHLNEMTLNTTDHTITGKLEAVGSPYKKYSELMEHKNTARYKKANAPNVLTQAHLYVSEYALGKSENISIPLTAVSKIDIYEKAPGASIASSVALGFCIAAIPATVLIIVFSFAGAD